MPPAIYTQSVVVLIWDFDKTLTHSYMQGPLFEEYGVDPATFWAEVNSLGEHYARSGLRVGKDTIYLNHVLTYVEHGKFRDLTNAKLKELGAKVPLAPGMPDFFDRMRSLVADDERYSKDDIKVEHYVVSTGMRAMIEGSAVAPHVDGIWACDFLPEAPPPGFTGQLDAPTSETIAQIGYTIDNTSKTKAIFEINKGVHWGAQRGGMDVNSLVPEEERRVPIRNMIYIADGPSDVPSFSVVNSKGGKTLGVYAPGSKNYESAASLQDQGRVNHIALADYTEGSAADLWLSRAIGKIADGIVDSRQRALNAYSGAPGHVI